MRLKPLLTIGEVITHELQMKNWQVSDAAQEINCNRVTLGRYLKNERLFDIKKLDLITELLGYPPGHFYSYYNCWAEGRQVRDLHKRVREFIIRCLEINLCDLVEENVENILEYKSYSDLYEIAQELKRRNELDEALKFFELVIEHETDRISHILAHSYYERFLIVRDLDMDFAFEAGVKLGEHVRNLEGNIRYEAYIKILNLFYVLDKWDHLEKYSLELVKIIEETRQKVNPIIYGEALIHLGSAYRKKGKFKEALKVIDKYESIRVGNYSLWSKGNRLLVEIDSGKLDKLADLCSFCRDNKNEAFAYLDSILELFVLNNLVNEADAFLEEFKDEISALDSLTNPRDSKRQIVFHYYKALLCRKRNKPWLEEIMVSIETAKKYKFDRLLNWCYELIFQETFSIGLFERSMSHKLS